MHNTQNHITASEGCLYLSFGIQILGPGVSWWLHLIVDLHG